MKTNQIASKTPARLDALESIIRAAFVPPFYATLSTHQMAAEMGCSQGQIRQYLAHLERAGRVLKSPDGRWVPTVYDALTRWGNKDIVSELLAQYNPLPSFSEPVSPALLEEMENSPIGRSILQGLKTPAQEADGHEGLSPRD